MNRSAATIAARLAAGARAAAAHFCANLITMFTRIITAARGVWIGTEPSAGLRVYFANHTSNGDFVVIWTVLPPVLRARTRPVAAADYWLATPLRAFVGREVFNAVLIDRRPEARAEDPVAQMVLALDAGQSLILFPEGKRNIGDDPLLAFKSGLYHLARQRPDVDLVPVWIANLSRIMPKGEVVPLPLLCTVSFGAPLHLADGESKDDFLARAAAALRDLGVAAA